MIDGCLFAQHRYTRAILCPASLQTDRHQMLGSQDACRHSLVICFARVLERFFNEGVVSRQELRGPAFNRDRIAFLGVVRCE